MQGSKSAGFTGIATSLLAILLAGMMPFAICEAAWASSKDVALESGGNLLIAEEQGDSSLSAKAVQRDFYWAGKDLDLQGYKVGGDILAAGMNIDVTSTDAGGSIRIACMNATLDGIRAANNIMVAAKDIKISDGESGGGVYVAGADIEFAGKASAAVFTGNSISFNGQVDGDVSIYGRDVTIGPDAVITGKLKIKSTEKPTIHGNAKVESLEHTLVDAVDEDAAAKIGATFAMLGVLFKVACILGAVIFAIVLAWMLRRPVDGAASMTRVHAGRIFATGAIASVAAPVLVVLLCCLIVTAPIGIVLLLALIALTIAAVPFAGAAFARLIFPNMNRIGSAAIGGAVLGIAAAIPFLGDIVTLVAFMFIIGYVIQAIWQGRGIPSLPVAAQAAQMDGAHQVQEQVVMEPWPEEVDDSQGIA